MEAMLPLALPPGFANFGTEYQAKNRYYTGDKVRFYNGTLRPIGGWLARTLTGATVVGTPSGAVQYTPEINGVAQAPVLCFGTTSGLYVVIGTVRYDITPDDLGSDTDWVWSFDVFGSYLVAVASAPDDYTAARGLYVWTGDPTAPAALVENAPLTPTGVVVTPERFCFQLGGVDPLGPNFTNYPTVPSPRTVFWPSQETLTDWTPTPVNSAGNFPLTTEGSLLAGVRVRGQTLLLTTVDAHAATYIGGEFVYRFDRVGNQCGVISKRAAVSVDAMAFWMGTRSFFAYDGYTKPLPCEVEDYVFGDFNRAKQHLVWGYSNGLYGEVTWHYPSAASSVCDRYVTFNYREGHWVFGTLARTAGVASQPPGVVPVLLDATGVVYDHETGTAMDGATVSAETGPIELGEGDRVMRVQRLIPDEKTLGQVTATLYARLHPNDAETSAGPYTLTATTSVRLTGRQIRVKLTQVAPADWRVGTLRLGVIPGGMR